MNNKRENTHAKPSAMPKGGPHIYTGPTKKPKDMKGTLKRLLNDIGTQKKTLLLVLIIVLVNQIVVQTSTILYGQTIKHVENNISAVDATTKLVILVVLAGVAYLISALIQITQQYFVIGIAQNTVFGMRKQLFARIQKLSLRFFDTHDNGDLMSRLTNDVETISNTLSNSLINLIASVSSLIFTLVMMIYFSWRLTLVSLITVPLILLLTTQFSKVTRKLFRKQQSALGNTNAHIEESVTGQKVVKVFAKEKDEIAVFRKLNQTYTNAAIKAQVMGGIMGPTMGFINNLTFLLIAFVGSIMVVNGTTEVWLLSQFFIYAMTFGRPLSALAQMMPQMQSAIAGAERVYEILDKKDEIRNIENPLPVTAFKGKVSFKDVTFSYLPDTPVLKNINIEIEPGQTVALVGPTGSGKTTIINLLTRFYDIQQGEILIDGINIKHLKKEDLRKQLAIVLQDVYLFTGTVRDNIRYGRLDATDEEIVLAAKKANAHQFIRRLPHGYDTVLSEDAANLSQGQRQLLSIARAMLANPSILILDEATSSVDTRTEINIQRAMAELMENKTSFVIAHRLSTIKNADLIIVIRSGAIIEQGTHTQLLNQRGFYYQLYNSQFKLKKLG